MAKFENGRERPANYIGICNTIADSYPFGIAHGVQKDAIQNAVDATRGKGPTVVEFRVVENTRGRFFTITDTGTVGLTGPLLDVRDYEEDLPEDYHWARFESFAFTKDNPDAIGARGQGKFIFLRASETYTMYYDTLRQDGVYRLGATQAKRTGCPILPGPDDEAWEGKRARDELGRNCGLRPLSEVGTRVIIESPVGELLEALDSGDFVRAIQQTWFRLIEKGKTIIRVHHRRRLMAVDLPEGFPLPSVDSDSHKAWVLGRDFTDDKIAVGREECRVKKFTAVYLNKGTIEEDLRGIAIVHNGMKVCSLEMTSAPPQVRERVTGYIEFDKELDHELRKGENQDPNHYDLKWRRRVPRAIKEYVGGRLEEFGRAKLGIGVDPRELRKRRRNDAESWAMRQLMRYATDLDLFGGAGPKRQPRKGGSGVAKAIGCSIQNFTFPDPDLAPRVDWGSQFEGVWVDAHNWTGTDRECLVSLRVLSGSSEVLVLADRSEVLLRAGTRESFERCDISVEKEIFTEPGEYRIKASLIDAGTGDSIDDAVRRFWVEKDPPFRAPFVLQGLPDFAEPYEHRQWLTEGSLNDSAVLYYNTRHPAYRVAEAQDEEAMGDYLFDIVLSGAMLFVLNRPDAEDGSPDFHPLDAGNVVGKGKGLDRNDVPASTHFEIARYVSETRWKMLEGK